MNKKIQRNKGFRNPSIYEKFIDYCKIDEFGTNYPVVSRQKSSGLKYFLCPKKGGVLLTRRQYHEG